LGTTVFSVPSSLDFDLFFLIFKYSTGECAVNSLEIKTFHSHKGGGHGRMVVGFTTTCAISGYQQYFSYIP
jgi:hypothetical protein